MGRGRWETVRHESGNHSTRRWMPAGSTGADYLRSKKRRKRNAVHMRQQRERCDALGQCRQCRRRVAVSWRTGKRAKLCRRHLAADWNRKMIYPLPWLERGELWYPLEWEERIL